MRKCSLLLIVALLALCCGCGQKTVVEELNIIPEPQYAVQREGSFTISKNTAINFQNLGQNNETAKYISRSLRKLHFHPSLSSKMAQEDCITFVLNDTANSELGPEGYLIEVRDNGILVSANTETGLFYGYQTFLQILPTDITKVRYSRIEIPQCTILDNPRFAWRGSHLDVSRHFFSVKEIKSHLDLMAAYKFNKFHWHLTDDHGWRIEIEKYPELNDIGSWRVDRSNVAWGEAAPAMEGESADYGGYYTKEEIREVVQYAASLHIDVIPEIEIPGHCSEILAAYPQFGCANDDTTYQVQIGPYWPPRAILCAGNDSVIQFLRDIMDEIIPLFPYEYIHVGGDEAVKENWHRCPKCQRRVQQLGLDSVEQLQGWMIREIAQYLELQGRHVIGWDELLDDSEMFGGPSAPGGTTFNGHAPVVMSWRGVQTGAEAARRGFDAIMCPTEYCYLDYLQGNPEFQPAAMPHLLPLRKVYKFDPMPAGLTPAESKHILGGQCNLWTEYINTYDHAQYMLLPRMLAISECLWSQPANKDWMHFRHKVVSHKQRLSSHGYRYCEGSFMPIVTSLRNASGDYTVTIESEVEGAQIFFCVGDTPTEENRVLYTGPLTLSEGDVVKAIVYYNGTAPEQVYSFTIGMD